jgi:outer membrane protein
MTTLSLRPLLAASLLALTVPAAAADPTWMMRLRAIAVEPDASSSISGLDVKGQWAPELDFTYFFNRNVSAELILATTRHEVTLNGTSLGKVSVLPPTITLQYHFNELGAFQPYVGGGLNLTWFYNAGLKLPNGTNLGIDSTSVGGAVQGGFDWEFAKGWYFNADVKYVWMSTDVNLPSGANLTNLKINPWIYGLGVGYRF